MSVFGVIADENRARAIEILAEPSPCDDCAFVARCAQRLLACEQFHAFVVAGSRWQQMTGPRLPTRGTYRKLDSVNGGVDETATPEFQARWEQAMHKNPIEGGDNGGGRGRRQPTRTPAARSRPMIQFANRTKSLPPSTPCTDRTQ